MANESTDVPVVLPLKLESSTAKTTMTGLSVAVLGPLQIAVDGQALTGMPAVKAQALLVLVYPALTGRAHSRVIVRS